MSPKKKISRGKGVPFNKIERKFGASKNGGKSTVDILKKTGKHANKDVGESEHFAGSTKLLTKKEFTQDLRVEICTLRAEGYSYGHISKKLGISKNGAISTVEKFKKTGKHDNKDAQENEHCTGSKRLLPKKEFSQDLRFKICTLRSEGHSYGQIAKKLGISKNGAKFTFDRFKKTGEFTNERGRGRKRCTNDEEDKEIVTLSLRDGGKKSAQEICEKFNIARLYGAPVSVTTVKARLKSFRIRVKMEADETSFEINK